MMPMRFSEFSKAQFPEKSVFDRVINGKKLDFFTNLVKWLAIRFAYVLYRLGIYENVLDVVSFPVSLVGYLLLSRATYGEKWFPLAGIAIIYFHVFVDFTDGPIAKARGTCSELGTILDELGGYADRLALLTIFGIFSGYDLLIILNVFAGGVFSLLIIPSRDKLSESVILNFLFNLYVNKYSLFSIRFMLGILPFVLATAIALELSLKNVSLFFSALYLCPVMVWLFFCLFEKQDLVEKIEKRRDI